MKLKQKGLKSFNILIICLMFVFSSSCFAFSQDSIPVKSDYNGDCALDLADAIMGLKVLTGMNVSLAENKNVRMEGVIFILQNIISDCPVNPCAIGDDYENDDRFENARVVILNESADNGNRNSVQKHGFHEPGDEDWVMFCGLVGQTYTIQARTEGPESKCDPVIELYDTDGTTLLKSENDGIEGQDEILVWENHAEEGTYYVRVRNFNPQIFGEDIKYALGVQNLEGSFPGDIIGNVIDKYSGEKIINATVKTSANRSAISNYCHCYFYCSRDYCIYYHPADPYKPYILTAEAPGYKFFSTEVTVRELETTVLDIELEPEDYNNGHNLPDGWFR